MKILIDADGCPVVKQTVSIARKNKIEAIIFCDTSHIFRDDYAEVVTVSRGADSVDFALVNRVEKNDIAVTQDYGLAAMVLSKGGRPVTQNGMIISDKNLTLLLTGRYEAKKARAAGVHMKGSKKRSEKDNAAFIKALTEMISEK